MKHPVWILLNALLLSANFVSADDGLQDTVSKSREFQDSLTFNRDMNSLRSQLAGLGYRAVHDPRWLSALRSNRQECLKMPQSLRDQGGLDGVCAVPPRYDESYERRLEETHGSAVITVDLVVLRLMKDGKPSMIGDETADGSGKVSIKTEGTTLKVPPLAWEFRSPKDLLNRLAELAQIERDLRDGLGAPVKKAEARGNPPDSPPPPPADEPRLPGAEEAPF